MKNGYHKEEKWNAFCFIDSDPSNTVAKFVLVPHGDHHAFGWANGYGFLYWSVVWLHMDLRMDIDICIYSYKMYTHLSESFLPIFYEEMSCVDRLS